MNIARMLKSGTNRMNALRLGVRGSVPFGSVIRGRPPQLVIGSNFFSSGPVWLEAVAEYEGYQFDPRIVIGDGVRTSPRLHVSSILRIRIGNDCLFGENVFIADHQHGATSGASQIGPDIAPALRPLGGARPIDIADRCHFGNNVVVLPGSRIGRGAIIGANSVVSGEVPANTIAAGAPARTIKRWDSVTGTWRPVRGA